MFNKIISWTRNNSFYQQSFQDVVRLFVNSYWEIKIGNSKSSSLFTNECEILESLKSLKSGFKKRKRNYKLRLDE